MRSNLDFALPGAQGSIGIDYRIRHLRVAQMPPISFEAVVDVVKTTITCSSGCRIGNNA